MGIGIQKAGRPAIFCWIERGACQLIRPGGDPVLIQQGDFALIYTSTPFTLTSDTSI